MAQGTCGRRLIGYPWNGVEGDVGMVQEGVAQSRGHRPSFKEIVLKSAIVHTATYFVVGASAFYAFNYAESFSTGPLAEIMRPTSDPMVAAGPMFQPIRGVLFGLVFYMLRDFLFVRNRGWLIMWVMLAILGILNTFGASPGSIEGAIYTKFTISTLYEFSLIEVYGQALLLSVGVFYWVRNPHLRWLDWGFSIFAGLAILASLAGTFLEPMAV